MGLGALVFMSSERTRTPIACILVARSNMPVIETTSFSNRAPSIWEAIRQSMVSAPAGPRVVMMCMTLIILVFFDIPNKMASSVDQFKKTDFSFGFLTSFSRNDGFSDYTFSGQVMRIVNEFLIQSFVCL